MERINKYLRNGLEWTLHYSKLAILREGELI